MHGRSLKCPYHGQGWGGGEKGKSCDMENLAKFAIKICDHPQEDLAKFVGSSYILQNTCCLNMASSECFSS
jgi:hypothetical protein